jgi:hypothetical protein
LNRKTKVVGLSAALFLVFSIIVVSNQDQTASDIQELVTRVHDASQADYGSYCLLCHGNIYNKYTITRKWMDIEGVTTTEESKNQHIVHKASEVVDFNNECTFCHSSFEVTPQPDAVLIESYVNKTTCASCHSRFAPRDLMDRDLQEISKDPPPGFESCTCACCHFAWPLVHTLLDVSDRFIQNEKIGTAADDCLTCHGENPFILPRQIQDEYWHDKESVGSEYATD